MRRRSALDELGSGDADKQGSELDDDDDGLNLSSGATIGVIVTACRDRAEIEPRSYRDRAEIVPRS